VLARAGDELDYVRLNITARRASRSGARS
jgi:hypothetical protein